MSPVNMQLRTPEQRVMVLLNLLDAATTEAVLKDLPRERQQRLSESLRAMRETPPDRRLVHDVLQEFDRLLRFALKDDFSHNEISNKQAKLSDDPFVAITQVSEIRMIATLKEEAPRTVALILNAMSDERAANILQKLPTEQRDAVVMQLKEKITPSMALLKRLLVATIAKCQSFIEQELVAETVMADARVARLLRTMEAERRGEVLMFLEQADPQATDRIRSALFSIDDLMRLEDKTLQRVLGEVDTRALAIVLKAGPNPLRQRVLGNLSKRGREALNEEIELLSNVSKSEQEDANAALVKAMIELDRIGELKMKQD